MSMQHEIAFYVTRQEGKTKGDREREYYYHATKLFQKKKLFEIIFLSKLISNYDYCGTKAHFLVTFLYQ